MTVDGESSPCEGCGGRVEVYGSSWCPTCATALPQYTQKRLLTLRNAAIDARYARTRAEANRILERALTRDPT